MPLPVVDRSTRACACIFILSMTMLSRLAVSTRCPAARASLQISLKASLQSHAAASPTFCRALHPSPPRQAGRTNLFATPARPNLSGTPRNDNGFILSDDLVVPGGVVFLGGRALLWDVDPPVDPAKTGSKGLEGSWEGWDLERFKVFEVVVPRPGTFSADL